MALTPLPPSAAVVVAAPDQPSVPPHNHVPPAHRVTPALQPQRAHSHSQAGADDPFAASQNLQQTLEELNDKLGAWSTNLRFELDEDTSRVVVQVVDVETGEVVRQIPSEDMVHMSKMLGKLQDLAFRSQA